MAPNNRPPRLPDLLLERYLADDLRGSERTLVAKAVKEDATVAARLAELARAREAFLAEHPPAAFVRTVAATLAVRRKPSPRRRRWTWVLGPSLATATALGLVLTVSRVSKLPATKLSPTVAAPSVAVQAPTPLPEAVISEVVGASDESPATEEPHRTRRSEPAATRTPELSPRGRKSQAQSTDFEGDARGGSLAAKDDDPQLTVKSEHVGTGRIGVDTQDQRGAGGVVAKPAQQEEASNVQASREFAAPPVAAAQPPSEPAPVAAPAGRTVPSSSTVDASLGDSRPAAPTSPTETKRSAQAAKQKMDDVVADKPKSAAKGRAVATELSKEDVTKGVRANATSLGPCLQAARAGNEIATGKHTLMLDFVITPSGGITGGVLSGPAYVRGTSLPACFAKAMKGWTFPASKAGAPVKNFPLPFTAK